MKLAPWLKWSLLAALPLVLSGAYMMWVVVRFDAQTLPAHYGQVAVQLYAGNGGGKRPLLVGLGGAEGGNAWARPVWKKQRDRFIAQGYAVLALGYFGAPGTPEKLDRISLDGIHAAIV